MNNDFPTSIFDLPAPTLETSIPALSKPINVNLQEEFRKLQRLQQKRSDLLKEMVQIDADIEKQMWILEDLVDNEVVLPTLSSTLVKRQSSIDDLSSKRQSITNNDISKRQSITIDDDTRMKKQKTNTKKRLLNSIKSYMIGKTDRKQRSILTYPHKSSWTDTITTTSLDGKIQFWNSRSEKRDWEIDKDEWSSGKDWVEHVRWISKNTLALCSFSYNHLTLLDFSERDIRRFTKRVLPAVHTKPINVIEPFHRSDTESCFFSGGTDKQIILWNVSYAHAPKSQLVHNNHTSRILSLCYNQKLYSGGQDCRLFCVDVETKRVDFGFQKLSGAVRDIIPFTPNPCNTLLTFIQDPDYTLRMFDMRTNQFVQTIKTSVSIQDQYQSISTDGYLCTVPFKNGFEIFDLRYTKVAQEKGQEFAMKERVLSAIFVNDKMWVQTTNMIEVIEYI